jgi:predicted DNA-binding transcriptional regulator YafY
MPLPSNRLGPDPRISSRRAARLYRLLTTLAEEARSRSQLIRQGRAGMRTFYRDLSFLEGCGIAVGTGDGRYGLTSSLDEALAKLPFPTPELTFADVFELSKGRGRAAQKLRTQLNELIREPAAKKAAKTAKSSRRRRSKAATA